MNEHINSVLFEIVQTNNYNLFNQKLSIEERSMVLNNTSNTNYFSFTNYLPEGYKDIILDNFYSEDEAKVFINNFEKYDELHKLLILKALRNTNISFEHLNIDNDIDKIILLPVEQRIQALDNITDSLELVRVIISLPIEERIKYIGEIKDERFKFKMIGYLPEEQRLLCIDRMVDEDKLDYNIIKSYPFNEEIIKVLYKRERPDILVNANINYLLERIDNDKEYTYLDYVLDSIKQGKAEYFFFHYLPLSIQSINNKAKFYIIMARHNMIKQAGFLSESDLLKKENGITLLEKLLNIDSDLTINTILIDEIKSKPQIALILKSRGFEQKNVDISDEKIENTTNYIKGNNDRFGIGPFNQEGEMLLKELTSLFLSDGKSDKELISALVSGYRQSLLINYQVNVEELKRLIEVKQQNLDSFCYIKEEDSGYFSPDTGSVYCGNAVVGTILHETGHALHYYLTQMEVPDDYSEIISRASHNPEILRRAEEYSDNCFKLREHIHELVEKEYESLFKKYYTKEKIDEIRSTLEKSKEDKKKIYNRIGIPKEQLDILLNEIYTVEGYIAHQKRIFINERTDAVMQNEYGFLTIIGDILDAVYEGKILSNYLTNDNGKIIRTLSGHGIDYYYGTTAGFHEMIANFASISKSPDSVRTLKILKETVGEEVYDMISNFYYEKIVGLILEEKQTKKVGGR